MSAIRLARGFTGRDIIVKFEGCYHGHSDSLLVKAGSGALTFGVPSSPGVPADLAKHTLNLPFNDLEAATELFRQQGDSIACIIIEPITGNMNMILPQSEYLEGLRKLCDQYGVVLIFDEVMTGFRLDKGGVQSLYGICADIVCFGKVIGGGLPVGAFAASAEIMKQLAPEGPVYQAGTLSGNPLAMAAGHALLTTLNSDAEVYQRLSEKTYYLHQGISEALKRHDIPHTINRVGSMISVHFSEAPVTDFKTAGLANNARFKQFFHGMLNAGIYIAPSAFESWFITDALSYEDLDFTIAAVKTVARSI